MPYADSAKQREYNKLRMRKTRNSKLAVQDKTILEQIQENKNHEF